MKRTQVNFAIDSAAFIAFALLLSTGLLLQYQLPFRSGGIDSRGTGHRAGEQIITLLWGWTRHDWGQIHYWIAGLLVAILATHVILHWKWILSVLRGSHTDASGFRFTVGAVSLIGLMLLAVAPFVASTEELPRSDLQQRATPNASTFDRSVELQGSMTIAEVADATKLTVAELLSKLQVPDDVSSDERIGRLLRQHGMQMSELRRILGVAESSEVKETEP